MPTICYDWINLKISHKAIEELLARARFRYSEFFCGIIRDMLLEDENIRPCFEDLHALLLPY